MKPRLFVEQKITAFTNKYAVYAANAEGEKGELVAFAQQKRLAFKEKVTFYSDEAKTNLVFTFRAEKALDVHGRYFVEDPNGQMVGSFKKDFAKSLLNSTWLILDKNEQSKFKISESNKVLAILRRFLAFVPIVGDIAEIILLFFRYHFVFTDTSTGEPVGKYQKTTLFRDHYTLSMTDEAYAKEDWRTLAAMAVGLDALQSR
jgi:uncharacterized protein YxjI